MASWLRGKGLERHGIVFTGDADAAQTLDDHDTIGKLVRAAWEAPLVLCDYVRARASGNCDHGVHRYLEHTPQGYRQWPPN